MVENLSDFPIYVSRVVTSCSCTKLSPKNFTVLPRQSQKLDLEFLPRQESSRGSQEIVFDLEFQNSNQTLLTTQLTAHVYNPIVLGERQISFDAPPLFGQAAVSRMMRIFVPAEVESVDIVPPKNVSIIDVHREPLASGTAYSFRASLPPSNRLGEFSHEVQIIAGMKRYPPATFSVACTGNVNSDILFLARGHVAHWQFRNRAKSVGDS